MGFWRRGLIVAGIVGVASSAVAEPVKDVSKVAATKVAALPAETAAAVSDASGSAAKAEASKTPPKPVKAEAKPVKTASLTPPTKRRAPSTVVRAVINLSSQRMTVKVNGAHRYTWKISSGRAGYHTPRGSFRPSWMSKMWYSRQYDGAPMPYAVFFNRGIATHGTNAVSRLGRPASHGCIRLRTPNARKFYNLVRKYGKSRVRIVVKGSTPRSSTPVARRNSSTRASRRAARREVIRSDRRRAALARRRASPRGGPAWWREAARSQRRARIRYRRQTRQLRYVRRPAATRRPVFRRPRSRLVFPGDR